MSVLGWLTLGYAAVLVIVLATSLTAIALYLRSTSRLLGEAREALERVRDHTAPLEGPLAALEAAVSEVAEQAADAIGRPGRRPSRREEVGAGPPTHRGEA